MLFKNLFKFIYISFFVFATPKVFCNFYVHLSLPDSFIENLRDNIYVSPQNVISKKLSSTCCTSTNTFDCHFIKNENSENEKSFIKKKKIHHEGGETEAEAEAEVETEAESGIKYSYLHTNPFYTTIKPEKINIVEINKPKNSKKNIFYRFFEFFTKINIFQINSFGKVLPSYFIDKNKTYILNSSKYFTNVDNRFKVKGSCLGEHLDDIANNSFFVPLSLAINKIEISKILKHAWNDSYSKHLFLESSSSHTNKQKNNVKKKDPFKKKNMTLKKIFELRENKTEKIEFEKNMYENINYHGLNTKKYPLIQNNDNDLLLNYIMGRSYKNRNHLEILENKKDEIDINLANNILKKLNIAQNSNFHEVLKNNENVNIGFCTRKKKQKKNMHQSASSI